MIYAAAVILLAFLALFVVIVWTRHCERWFDEQLGRSLERIHAREDAGWSTERIDVELPLPTGKIPWYLPRKLILRRYAKTVAFVSATRKANGL